LFPPEDFLFMGCDNSTYIPLHFHGDCKVDPRHVLRVTANKVKLLGGKRGRELEYVGVIATTEGHALGVLAVVTFPFPPPYGEIGGGGELHQLETEVPEVLAYRRLTGGECHPVNSTFQRRGGIIHVEASFF
jgi:hypothetical protein